MSEPSSDVAFTPTVKRIQTERGSRHGYARMEERGAWETTITPELAAFIAERDSFYLATANADGQPYIQHRGGPRGFLRIIDETTFGFADFAGNKQYITLGNLEENDKAFVFLMDYANQERIKLWVRASVTTDPETIAKLTMPGYPAKAEQALILELVAWDANCSQHIPQLVHADGSDA